jgi:hypothetical protein
VGDSPYAKEHSTEAPKKPKKPKKLGKEKPATETGVKPVSC